MHMQAGDTTLDLQSESAMARNLLTLLVRDFAKDVPVTGGAKDVSSGGGKSEPDGDGDAACDAFSCTGLRSLAPRVELHPRCTGLWSLQRQEAAKSAQTLGCGL